MFELHVAHRAAQAAGEILTKYFHQGLAVARAKGKPHDLVSVADTEAEQAVVQIIRSACPEHAVLGEEGHAASTDAEHLWIIDPLDGTTNFLHQIPHFAVSIAYYRAGQPVCGVIYNPIRGDLYEAVRGGGARHLGTRLQVANHAALSETLIGVGFYYDRGAMMEATLLAIRDLFRAQIRGIRRFGTASLDLAQVASGSYGAYFEFELAPWDFAAGRLVVEEAGGRVTTCTGGPLPIGRSTLLAATPQLYQEVFRLLQPHVPAKSFQ